MIKLRLQSLRPALDDLDRMEHMLDLDRDNLAWHAMEIAATEIGIQCTTECDPDGIPWPALSPWYEVLKRQVAPGAPIGVLYGHMLAHHQLHGEEQIGPHHATQTYGIDAKAKEEAEKFQEGGAVTGTRQPPRPFYELGVRALAHLDSHFDQHFNTVAIT